MISIKSISIENFKSFGPRQKLPIKSGGVNFLFGPNSQGKSSCLLALGIIHEGLKKQNFNLDRISHADNSPDILIDSNLANYNRPEDPFCLSYEQEISFLDSTDSEKQNLYAYGLLEDTNEEKKYNLEISFHLSGLKDNQLEKFEFNEIKDGEKKILLKLKGETLVVNYDSDIFKYLTEGYLEYLKARNEILERDNISGVHEFKKAFRIPGYLFLTDMVEDPESQVEFDGRTQNMMKHSDVKKIKLINSFLKQWFRSDRDYKFDWIGANRYNPQKNYIVDQEKGIVDERFLAKEYVDELNRFLRNSEHIDIGYELVVNKQEKEESFTGNKAYKWGVKPVDNETKILNLSDIGSGISHIFQILLPLSVVDINRYGNIQVVDEERVVIIQQPEIHLHPSLQIQLAKACFELSKKNNITLIIETHSEHFIKAAQLEVAKSNNLKDAILTKDRLAVLYVSKDQNGYSNIKEIEVDETGSFTEPWPDDFFELSADLGLERLRSSLKSRN